MPAIAPRMASDEVVPPVMRPANAPMRVSRRHQMPSTSKGQNVDAAIANAHPTRTLIAKGAMTRPAAVATVPMTIDALRNARTPPRSKSCESAPAALINRPDDVDRKAAKAPAAVNAVRTAPDVPPTSMRGKTKTTESVCPVV